MAKLVKLTDNQRNKLVVAIVKNSVSYQCKHIDYKIVGSSVHIFDARDNETFSATELCSQLSGFNQYFTIDEGKIVLRIF